MKTSAREATRKLITLNRSSLWNTHHIQTTYIQQSWCPCGCWPHSGMCHCPFYLVWWWLVLCPPQSCAQCLADLLHLWTTVLALDWKKYVCQSLVFSSFSMVYIEQTAQRTNEKESNLWSWFNLLNVCKYSKYWKYVATYIGLPMETHSSLKYCPSCGRIIECVISSWGASAKKFPKFNAIDLLY